MTRSTAAKITLFASISVRTFAQHVHTDSDPTATFGSYHTFAWRSEAINTPDPAINNPIVQRKIEAEIEKQLMARGLTKGHRRPT